MKARLVASLLLGAASVCMAAEVNFGAQKPEEAGPKATERLRLQELQQAPAELALPPLGAASKRRLESSMEPNQIGVSRNADMGALGTLDETRLRWEGAGEGVASQLRVSAPEAAGLRVGLRFDRVPKHFEIRIAQIDPDGTRQVVASIDTQQLAKLHGGILPFEYWTPSTEGETQLIELRSRAKPGAHELRFTVFDVSHLLQRPIDPVRPKVLKYTCHVDISCIADSSVRSDGRAVARMIYVKGGGSFVCTGALLNDRVGSLTPLFATANHCISTSAVAASLETSWFYYPASCGGAAQTPTRLSGGAALLLTDFDTDFTLLRLNQSAPGGAYFLGWDPNPLAPGGTIFGIHHPDGQFQRYSAGSFVSQVRTTNSGTGITFGQLFNRVRFSQGIVEGGSSGSPLLTAPSFFRGTLFGSPASNTCGGSNNVASYSDFAVVYPLINTYLSGPAVIDDYGDSAAAATFVSANAEFSGELNRASDQDWFRFTFDSPGDWSVSSFDAATGVRIDTIGTLYASNGITVVATSDDRLPTDTNFEISFRVAAAGTYYLKVTGYESTVGRYKVRSRLVLPDDHGDAAGTASSLAANGGGGGFLGAATDADWFRVSFDRAGTFTVTSDGTTDVIGTIFQPDGTTVVAENDDANPPDRNFSLSVGVDGATTGYVRVTGYDGALGAYGFSTSFTSSSTGAANYTDLWWNSAESGWGINLNHQGDIIFATLFTYAADGRDMWLVASDLARQPNGTFTGALYRTLGPAFNAAQWSAVTVSQAGTMTLTFTGTGEASLAYSVNGVNVTKTIRRQVFSTPPSCTFTTASRSGATNYQDLWWNPAESGWGLNITHQGTLMFASLFTYAADNRNMWLVASALARQADGSYAGSLYRTNGPAFNAAPWTQVGVTQVGTMRLAFTNGISGMLTYTVNGVPVTKQIERQVFATQTTVCQ